MNGGAAPQIDSGLGNSFGTAIAGIGYAIAVGIERVNGMADKLPRVTLAAAVARTAKKDDGPPMEIVRHFMTGPRGWSGCGSLLPDGSIPFPQAGGFSLGGGGVAAGAELFFELGDEGG